MTDKQKYGFIKLIQNVSNEVLQEMKNHFKKTDIPLGWMHSSLDEDEVNSIKKIIVLDVWESEITDYYKITVKVILDGKKIAREFEPADTLDSMDYRLEEITGLKIYLYCDDVEAEDFNPQW